MTNKIKYTELIIECDSTVSSNLDSSGPDCLRVSIEKGSVVFQVVNDLEESNTVCLSKNGMEALVKVLQNSIEQCG